jgi:hypothetical protein
VERAGYPVTRIDEYSAWLRTFRERLERLGPAEQRRSALAGLSAWEHPAGRDRVFYNRRLRERLQTLAEPAEMPRMDEDTIRRYLGAMASAGLIPRAARLSAA